MLHPQDRVLSTLNSAGGNTVSRHARPPIPPAADNGPGCAPRVLTGPRLDESAGAKPAFRRGALASSVESSSSGTVAFFIDAAAAYRFYRRGGGRAGLDVSESRVLRAATRKLWAGAAARE